MARVQREVGPVGLAIGPVLPLVTVPVGERWVVRAIQLVNSSGPGNVQIGINGLGAGDLIWRGTVGATSFNDPGITFVLEAGDELWGTQTVGSTVTITVSCTVYPD